MQITFLGKKAETENIFSFNFKREDNFAYTAGQFVEITLKHNNPDERGIKRWFTLSSSPTDDHIAITTKIDPIKSSSYKKALMNIKEGDHLSLNGPMGDFVLPKLIQTPLIFVAGGIGITPFSSIIKWLADTKEKRPIRFIYAVHTEEEIIFEDKFTAQGIIPTIVVSNPTPSWGGERGRLNAELVLGLTQPSEDSLIYVSGPENMTDQLERELKQAGIKPNQLVLDFFPNYGSI